MASAIELFARQGYHATTMADVARDGGLSLKALYDGFPSKETLFEAVLVDVGDRFAALLEAPPPSEDPVMWLQGFVARLVGLLAQNPSALRLYSRGTDRGPQAVEGRAADPFAGFERRVQALLMEAVLAVQERGGARGADPAVLARAVLTLAVTESRRRLERAEPVDGAADDVCALIRAMVA